MSSLKDFLSKLPANEATKDKALKHIKQEADIYVNDLECPERPGDDVCIKSWKHFPYPLFNVKDKKDSLIDIVFFMPYTPLKTEVLFTQYKAVGVVGRDFIMGGGDVTDIEVIGVHEYHPSAELDDEMRDRWCHILDQIIPQLPDRYPLKTDADLVRLSLIYLMCTELQPKRSFGESMRSMASQL